MSTVLPRRSRPPTTLIYDGRLYVRAGRGSLPCSAKYRASTGQVLTLLYCSFSRSTRDWSIFTGHGRGPEICVRRANMPVVGYGIFLAGPVAPHDDNYLRAERAWRCE